MNLLKKSIIYLTLAVSVISVNASDFQEKDGTVWKKIVNRRPMNDYSSKIKHTYEEFFIQENQNHKVHHITINGYDNGDVSMSVFLRNLELEKNELLKDQKHSKVESELNEKSLGKGYNFMNQRELRSNLKYSINHFINIFVENKLFGKDFAKYISEKIIEEFDIKYFIEIPYSKIDNTYQKFNNISFNFKK